jgi:hypothetical protein
VRGIAEGDGATTLEAQWRSDDHVGASGTSEESSGDPGVLANLWDEGERPALEVTHE